MSQVLHYFWEKMEMVTFCARLSMNVRCITICMVVLTFWWCYLEEGFGGRWWAWIGKHSLGRPSVIEERLPLKNEAIYSLELDCLHLCCPIPTTPLWSCRYKMGKFPSWGKQVLPTSGKVSLREEKEGGGVATFALKEFAGSQNQSTNQSYLLPDTRLPINF